MIKISVPLFFYTAQTDVKKYIVLQKIFFCDLQCLNDLVETLF